MEMAHQVHTFGPFYQKDSRILILGSFPSVKSRESNFYYGHPQNRFWKVTAMLTKCEIPKTLEEKKAFLLQNHIALWDVIASCDIAGSSDSSIRNVVPNKVEELLQGTQIRHIYVNGKAAEGYYRKYLRERTGREAIVLPSTSPANAAFGVDRLIENWKVILEDL